MQSGQSILIVDDEPQIRESLKLLFEALGLRAFAAESGNKAIALLRENTVDLVLSDVRMPDGDGFALLGWMRQHAPSIPVLLMSAYTDVDSAEMKKLGASGLVSKPFGFDQIRALVGPLLSKGSGR